MAAHGAHHIDVAKSWTKLGSVYFEQSRYKGAQKAHEKAKQPLNLLQAKAAISTKFM